MATRKPLIVNPDASQIQELPNGDSLDGITNITATGSITAVQPTCLLTIPKPYTANNTEDPSNHQGGTNEKPISFTNTTTNVNCTTSLASNATVNSGISSITVPSAGTYLVSACISGLKSGSSNEDDQIRFALAKSGISTFPNGDTYPTFVFGNEAGTGEQEFNCTFTLPLTLNASDTLSVHLSHIGATSADIEEGYFSITKLH